MVHNKHGNGGGLESCGCFKGRVYMTYSVQHSFSDMKDEERCNFAHQFTLSVGLELRKYMSSVGTSIFAHVRVPYCNIAKIWNTSNRR